MSLPFLKISSNKSRSSGKSILVEKVFASFILLYLLNNIFQGLLISFWNLCCKKNYYYVNGVGTLGYFFNHVFLINPFISFILTRCLFSIWSLFVHSKMYVDQIFFFSWYFKTVQPQTFIFIKRSVVVFFREPFIHNFNPQTLISSE